MEKNIFLTGLPGTGKTTLIRKVLAALPAELRRAGFSTAEMRDGGERIGFEIETLDGRKGLLASTRLRSPYRVGRYGVDLEGFEKLVLPLFRVKPVQLFVVDEIGRMECLSRLFVREATALLDSGPAVLGTVALKGGGFLQAVRQRADVRVVEVTAKNRDALAGWLVGEVEKRLKRTEGIENGRAI